MQQRTSVRRHGVLLATALAALAIVDTSLVLAAPFDHLQCFRIKDSQLKAEYAAQITASNPIFVAATQGCTIRTPARLLCVDASKTDVEPPPPGAAPGQPAQTYFCYRAKCPLTQPSTSLTDQFGTHLFAIKSTRMVCAPVSDPMASTTTTTTLDCPDADNDLWTTCAGDCDDGNAAINPDAGESCDGFDNDCDGAVDEGNPDGGAPCNTGQLGICAGGVLQCSGGALLCEATFSPEAESCDGLDNDCDGVADEGNPGGGMACNTGQPGICASGSTNCAGGAIACEPVQTPSAEICDGQDNDCDGQVDEGNPQGGGACSTGEFGVCEAGTVQCIDGAVQCVQNVSPSTEICDGLDNDCDGVADEDCP